MAGWVSPTGHSDWSSQWSNETNIYDGSTSTSGSTTSTSGYLELTLSSPISCDKIRIYVSVTGTPNMDILLYYGSQWNEIYSDNLINLQWNEISIGSTQTVSGALIRFNSPGGTMYVREFEFNEVGGAGPADNAIFFGCNF